MRNSFTNRLYLFSILFGLMFSGVILRVLLIQTSQQAIRFQQMSDESMWQTVEIKPERGKIYDRNGNMLAGNKTVYEIGVTLTQVQDLEALTMTISGVMGIPYEELYTTLTTQPESQVYLILSQFVPANEGKILDEMFTKWYTEGGEPNMAGLVATPRMQRSYPNNELASSILGFVHTNNEGYYGIEEKYNSLLAGVPILVQRPNNPTLASGYTIPAKGSDLLLTIDRDIQMLVEDTLAQYLDELDAKSGTIVIMDPTTGEILGMASTPQINLNEPGNFLELYKTASEYNRAVSTQYEPGSIFKILTMAAALDSGIVAPGTTYLDTGFFELNGVNIFNWDRGAWGVQDMTGCMQNSLNVCMARLAVTMGPETFYNYLNRFGIGRPTGVDIAGEARGSVPDPNQTGWIPLDMGVNSFGQGVAVTPMQIITAISAVANNGQMVTPHVVRSMITNGQQIDLPIQVLGTPIRPETAQTLSSMLAEAMDRNESVARIDGYRLATKTGTASVPGPSGYDPYLTNQSFVGWGPIDSPKFLVYIWFEEPKAQEWASVALSPIFEEVVNKLLIYLDLPPDSVRLGQLPLEN